MSYGFKGFFGLIASTMGINLFGEVKRPSVKTIKAVEVPYEPPAPRMKHSAPIKHDNPNVKTEEMMIQPFGYKKPVRAIVTKTFRRCARLRGAGKMWIITGVHFWPWKKGQHA